MYKILWKMGKSTGGTKIEDPEYLEQGDQAEVVFRPKMPIYLESFEKCEGLGRIAAMDSNTLVMLGKVSEIALKGEDSLFSV